MGITDSGFYREHQPRFSVQVLVAVLILVTGYFTFSLWDLPAGKLLGGLLMVVAVFNLASMIYLKIRGVTVLEKLAKKKEAKP